MKLQTQKIFNQYIQRQAELNHIEVDNINSFNVAPQPEQRFEEKVQENSDFLSKINLVFVDNQKGQKVLMGTNGTIAGRTDTTKNDRNPRDMKELKDCFYTCEQTNYDTLITYEQLDAWRHKKEFQQLYTKTLAKQIARDRLMIGFNGKQVASETDRNVNTKLEDVNIGWLQQIRLQPEHYLNNVRIGENETYKNLDALVVDAHKNFISEWEQDSTDLVVVCNSKLLNKKFFDLANSVEDAINQQAFNQLIHQHILGGFNVVTPPFFPENAFLITTFDNLSIYLQRGTTRRSIIDNPKRNQVEDFRSINEAFVVEDFNKVAFVEGIAIA